MRADYLADVDRYGLKLPVLRRLAAEGVSARRMIPVYPSVTYPAHTSLVTGCRPMTHGVLSNEPFQPLVDSRPDWYWFDRSIRKETLHRAFKRAGRTTAAIAWPVTVGARTIDYHVPEYWDPADFEGSFLAKLQAESTPELIEAACKRFGFAPDLNRLDEQKTLIARHIVLAHRPDLMLLHLADLDKKQHIQGPGTPDVLAMLENDDRLVGELLAAYREAGMADRLITVVLSDHGFEAVSEEFRPNAVLREAGLIEYDAARQAITGWKAKAWVHGGSAAVMLADRGDKGTRKRCIEVLTPYVGLAIERIVEPAELVRLGASHEAAFGLEPARGRTFGSSCQGEPRRASTVKGMHGQHPDRPEMAAAFIIAGPGIPRGKRVEEVALVDVAPTLARLAGVRLPEAEGKAIEECLGERRP